MTLDSQLYLNIQSRPSLMLSNDSVRGMDWESGKGKGKGNTVETVRQQPQPQNLLDLNLHQN